MSCPFYFFYFFIWTSEKSTKRRKSITQISSGIQADVRVCSVNVYLQLPLLLFVVCISNLLFILLVVSISNVEAYMNLASYALEYLYR